MKKLGLKQVDQMTDVPLYYSKELFISINASKQQFSNLLNYTLTTVNLENILWTIMCPCYYSFLKCNSSVFQHLMAVKILFTHSSLGGVLK